MSDGASSGCGGCEGRCCSFYIVPVTGQDVWRIVQGQRLDPLLFVQSEPEATPTEHGFLLRANGPTYALSLQHDHTRHKDRVCIFLLHLRDGVRRCGMYAHRPRACQTYPMHIEKSRIAARTDMLCPSGSWQHSYQQEGYWRELLNIQDAEWQTYRTAVQHWNTHVRSYDAQYRFTFQQYLDYLVNAYDTREAGGWEEGTTGTQDPLAALLGAYLPT